MFSSLTMLIKSICKLCCTN